MVADAPLALVNVVGLRTPLAPSAATAVPSVTGSKKASWSVTRGSVDGDRPLVADRVSVAAAEIRSSVVEVELIRPFQERACGGYAIVLAWAGHAKQA